MEQPNQSSATDEIEKPWDVPVEGSVATPISSESTAAKPDQSLLGLKSQPPLGTSPVVRTEPVAAAPLPAPSSPSASVPTRAGISWGKWFAIVMIVIVIGVVVVIGLVFADDRGLLPTNLSPRLAFLPLSQMWGGLSAKPDLAATYAANALRNKNYFNINGTFSGYAGSLTSADVSSPPDTAVIDPLAKSGSFTLLASTQNYSLTFSADDSGIIVRSQYRVIDGELYTAQFFGSASDTTSPDQDLWIDAGKAPTLTPDTLKQQLTNLLAKSDFVAAEKVGSERAYRFHLAINASDVAISTVLPPASPWKSSNGSLDIWISRSTGLPVKIEAKLTESSAKRHIAIQAVFNQNAKAESFTVPTNIVDPNVFNTPDQIRKKDLAQIQSALNKYYSEKGSFPTASVIEHTDAPSGVLKSVLVPVYLDAIPVDPDPSHYYGYVSDGTTYELSAVLDDATDPEGTKLGAITLYTLKGGKP